jgi:hypothetical protein
MRELRGGAKRHFNAEKYRPREGGFVTAQRVPCTRFGDSLNLPFYRVLRVEDIGFLDSSTRPTPLVTRRNSS